jgi:hypothetical protein
LPRKFGTPAGLTPQPQKLSVFKKIKGVSFEGKGKDWGVIHLI